MLGPTKIYLAVQPSPSDGQNADPNVAASSQPPPLAPVQQSVTQQQQPQQVGAHNKVLVQPANTAQVF